MLLKNAIDQTTFCDRLALIHITSFSGGKVVPVPDDPYDSESYCTVYHSRTRKEFGPAPVRVIKEWIFQDRVGKTDYIKPHGIRKWIPIMETPLAKDVLAPHDSPVTS